MPSVPPVQIPNQVLPNGSLPYVQQMNFGQMIGEVSSYNPNSLAQIPVWINDSVRGIYDRKTWYGLFTKGQIAMPQVVSGGQSTVTIGSNIVQGTGTAWDLSLIGRQFRLGFNTPIYTITNVDAFAQQLTLELPWEGQIPPTSTSFTSGYFIVQYYYNFGPNVKYIKHVINVQMGFQLWTNLTQDFLNKKDPWRLTTNFPRGLAPMPADPNGNYIVEVWPAPFTQQAMPFMIYRHPPNLIEDEDTLPPYIRTDVVVKDVTARALRYRPKDNPYYDPATALAVARDFDQKFESALLDMANADEDLYRTSATIQGEDYPFCSMDGAFYNAQHAVGAGESTYGDWYD